MHSDFSNPPLEKPAGTFLQAVLCRQGGVLHPRPTFLFQRFSFGVADGIEVLAEALAGGLHILFVPARPVKAEDWKMRVS